MEINGFSSQSSVVNLLKTAASGGQNQNLLNGSSDRKNALIDLIATGNPEKASAIRKEQDQVSSIIQRLEASKVDLQDRLKQAASDKLEYIKAQIEALKLTAGGDPRTTAKQAARLARELASAVSDYANASSSSGPVSAAAIEGLAAGQDVTVTTTEVTEVTVSTLTIDLPAGSSAEQTAGLRDLAEKQIAELDKKLSDGKADEEFLRKARKLLDELERIVGAAKRELETQEGGVTNNSDIKNAEGSLRDVGQSLNQLSISIVSVSVSTTTTVNISA